MSRVALFTGRQIDENMGTGAINQVEQEQQGKDVVCRLLLITGSHIINSKPHY